MMKRSLVVSALVVATLLSLGALLVVGPQPLYARANGQQSSAAHTGRPEEWQKAECMSLGNDQAKTDCMAHCYEPARIGHVSDDDFDRCALGRVDMQRRRKCDVLSSDLPRDSCRQQCLGPALSSTSDKEFDRCAIRVTCGSASDQDFDRCSVRVTQLWKQPVVGAAAQALGGSPTQQQTAATNQQLSENELWRKYPPAPTGQGRTFPTTNGRRHLTVWYVIFAGEPALRVYGQVGVIGLVKWAYLFITPTRIVVWDVNKNQALLNDRREDVKSEISDKSVKLNDAKQAITLRFLSDGELGQFFGPAGLGAFLESAMSDLPGSLVAMGVPKPQPYGGASEQRQTARVSPEEAESDRQSKIQELQWELWAAQRQEQDDDARAAQLRQQAAQASNQGGGLAAIAAGIGIAGAAKLQNDAQTERQKIADLTRQIQQLQQETAAAQVQTVSNNSSGSSSGAANSQQQAGQGSMSGSTGLTPTPQLTSGCLRITNERFDSTAEANRLLYNIVNNCSVYVKVGIFVFANRGDTCMHGQAVTMAPGVATNDVSYTPINQMQSRYVADQGDQSLSQILVPNACSNPWLSLN